MAKAHDNSHGSTLDKYSGHRLQITSNICSEFLRYHLLLRSSNHLQLGNNFVCLSIPLRLKYSDMQTYGHWRRLATTEGILPQPRGVVQYREDWPLLAAWSSVQGAKEQYANATGNRPRPMPTLLHSWEMLCQLPNRHGGSSPKWLVKTEAFMYLQRRHAFRVGPKGDKH